MYERVFDVYKAKEYVENGYSVDCVGLENGMVVVVFDKDKKNHINIGENTVFEKILNIEQINWYLGLGLKYCDIGLKTQNIKGGRVRKFVYIKFIVDEEYLKYKSIWMRNER